MGSDTKRSAGAIVDARKELQDDVRLKQQLIVMKNSHGCLAVWLTDRVPSIDTFMTDDNTVQ